MENGEWRMENYGEWRMENGEWRMKNGEWEDECRMQNEEARMSNARAATGFLVLSTFQLHRSAFCIQLLILFFHILRWTRGFYEAV